MKRKTSHWVLLALALSTVLLLAACGASGSAAEGSQQKESVTGTINRLDTDYLVLITMGNIRSWILAKTFLSKASARVMMW